MKKKGYEKYMEKKKMLSGKRIVEIAPAKEKHQVPGKDNFNKDFVLYPPLTIGSATHVLFFIILSPISRQYTVAKDNYLNF